MAKWSVEKGGSQIRLLRDSVLIGIIYEAEYAEAMASLLTAAEGINTHPVSPDPETKGYVSYY